VGASGYVVNTAALALFADVIGIHYLIGAALATQVSTSWNYLFTDGWVYRNRSAQRNHLSRFSMFWLMNNASLLLRLPMMWALTDLMGVHHLISNVVSLGVVTILRFWASDDLIWADAR
jgi:putative flippase GtrA